MKPLGYCAFTAFSISYFPAESDLRRIAEQKYDGYAVFCKYVLNNGRENLKDFREQGKADSDAKERGTDNRISLAETGTGQHLHTADDDGTEHHDRTAPSTASGREAKKAPIGGKSPRESYRKPLS